MPGHPYDLQSLPPLANGAALPDLASFRAGKPLWWPDQAVHAEFAARICGLTFTDMEAGTGLLFRVSSADRSITFGAGRCSYFPQNNATATSIAGDKYFAARILTEEGIPSLQGDYFFLHQRYRAYRPPGHERSDAIAYLQALGGTAFVKPLAGSRGDFAQVISKPEALADYMDQVAIHHDAILIQPRVTGTEYRIFVIDGEVLYCARKDVPTLHADGQSTVGQLLDRHNANLSGNGLSDALPPGIDRDTVPAVGETVPLDGRRNHSAGGSMQFADPEKASDAFTIAIRAARALNLRVAGVDIFTNVNGDPDAMTVIEVNANPSVRFLENQNRGDLILRIWQHTFQTMGLTGSQPA